jgi:hypothetical protein
MIGTVTQLAAGVAFASACSLNIMPSLKRNTAAQQNAADDELMGARGDWWWTGLKPTACPGFDEDAGVLR